MITLVIKTKQNQNRLEVVEIDFLRDVLYGIASYIGCPIDGFLNIKKSFGQDEGNKLWKRPASMQINEGREEGLKKTKTLFESIP